MGARRHMQRDVMKHAARHGSDSTFATVAMKAVADHLMHSCCWRTVEALARGPTSAAAAGAAGGGAVETHVADMQQREGILKLIRAGELSEVRIPCCPCPCQYCIADNVGGPQQGRHTSVSAGGAAAEARCGVSSRAACRHAPWSTPRCQSSAASSPAWTWS